MKSNYHTIGGSISLFFILFSMFLIPAYSQNINSIQVFTDKPVYYGSDIIQIIGNVNPVTESTFVTIVILHESSYVHISQIVLDRGGFFTEQVIAGSELWVDGEYTIVIHYEDQSVETSFEYYNEFFPIQSFLLQTDKSFYNEIETIHITGQLYQVLAQVGDEVTINILDYQNNNLIPQQITQFSNSEQFSHDITTDESAWRGYNDIITIQAQFENHTATTEIFYSDYPADLSLETLHIRNLEHNSILDEHENALDEYNGTMTDYESIMYEQEDKIRQIQEVITLIKNTQISFQTIIDDIIAIIEGLTGTPVGEPSDAPIIISITADDPDNMDEEYSNDDTITILFDSDTNRPGGTGTQQKLHTNNIFTFTESLGVSYNGVWTTADTFVITINSARNAGPPIIGNTTVTPTEITLILSADDSSTPSSAISPVLIGDWGIIPVN